MEPVDANAVRKPADVLDDDVRADAEDLNLKARMRRLGTTVLAKLKRNKVKGAAYPPIRVGAAHRHANKDTFGDNRLTTYKYTFISFLPKFLFSAFRKATNIYFLIMTIITFIPAISPLPGWTAALPFALVLLASMIKEIIEDYKRHAADRIINRRPVTTIGDNGLPRTRASADLVVGDFVVVQQNQEIPADIIVMATSDPEGVCYIETAQLDGETNLKRRFPFRATEKLPHESFANISGSVLCSSPSFHLDEFSGALELDGFGKRQPVDDSNLVIRGTNLRNTLWIVGLVVYTGFQTKLALNSSAPPSKYSALNKMVDIMVVVIIGIKILFCIIAAALAAHWAASGNPSYLLDSTDPTTVGIKAFFSYAILLSYVVPQTLMISLEIAKLIQGRWVEWDVDMALDPMRIRQTGAKARSTDQNDELGRVRWIMSDKTGTLTANEMKMVRAVVDGATYSDAMQGPLLRALRQASTEHARMLSEYMFSLAVGHSVSIGEVISDAELEQKKASPWKMLTAKMTFALRKASKFLVRNSADPVDKAGQPLAVEMGEARTGKWKDLVYKGSSPDEEAFVAFTKANGFVFSSRVRDELQVTVEIDADHPDVHTFTILHTLEYSSARAMMSVVCRDRYGTLVVYAKGADSRLLPLLNPSVDVNPPDRLKHVTTSIDKLADMGLRTLVVARRTLDPAFYADWAERLRRATTGEDGTLVDDRKAVQLRMYAEIERDFELLGVTAVEDRLQDLVPESIAYFLDAGIRFVMITGDKLGTAENIARATRLITRDMTVVHLADAVDGAGADELLRNAEARAREAPRLAIVVDGATLKFLLKPALGLSDRFYALLQHAAATVCCRTNPRQKAKVVSLVRAHNERDIILAIGDGGNDVSMIQKAHIGVGLVGKDGTQAARSSDYALRTFHHLKKLIAVHGRWNYLRNSTIVQYWVYKNVAFIFVLYFYGFFCGFSGSAYYDAWVLTLYNVFFTSLPPLFFAFFEQDVSTQSVDRYPQLYGEVQMGRNFTVPTFMVWIAEALYTSTVCYFVPYAVWTMDILDTGLTSDMSFQGNAVSVMAITVVNLRMLMETRNLSWVIHLSYWISFGLLLFVLGIETILLGFTPNQYGVFEAFMGSGVFWLTYLLVVVLALLPAWLIKTWLSYYSPWDSQIAREIEKEIKAGRMSAPEHHSASKLVEDAAADEIDQGAYL